MKRKVIIDCDMGTDDAVALCMLLFDERLDILAITAAEGCVRADQANSNLQAILQELDPDRYPRLGEAFPTENAPPINTTYLYGEDGLGNTRFEVSRLQHLHAADKLIIDCVRAHPGDVTVLCLGPLTNLSRAFCREPNLPELIDRVIIAGGSVCGTGNITQSAEFNFYFDPESARDVIRSRTTKTLIPLDVTTRVDFGFEFLDEIPKDVCRVGKFLHDVLPYSFRTYRQQLGQESIFLNDVIGGLSLLEPQLFSFQEMACDIETCGELTRGMTVFDRRTPPEWRHNLEVAVDVNAESARQFIIDNLCLSGNQSR